MDTSQDLGRLLDGRYRIGRVIARGGMSTVYRGLDTRLDRPVAIKVMTSSYAADPAFLARFEREARLTATVHHPGVVSVYDQGQDGDAVFLVMELVDGGTLRDLIRQSAPLPVPVAMTILLDLLQALGAAHAAGLVHRDVKPENVLISAKGEVKVADFGLVRAVTSQTMATGDVILGTVSYLSPEQVAVGTADARSDVYAAGIVAYEMLVGRPPFSGDNAIAVAYQHVNSDVPAVTDHAPGVPLELDDLLLAATRRDPQARPADATRFAAALAAVGRHTGITRVPVPTPQAGGRADGDTPVGPGGTRMVSTPSAPTRQAPPVAPTTVAPTTAGPTGVVPTSATVRNPRPKRSRRARRALIAILVILLLAAAAALGGWWLGGRWAYAPAVVGQDQPAAMQQVIDAGLIPELTTAPDDSAPSGTVSRTDPTPGAKMLRGSPVTVVVSSGRPMVPVVPAGSTVQAARVALEKAALTPKLDASRDQYSDSVAAGAVIGTEPAAGVRLPIAAPVVIVTSRGQRSVTVPTVAGKSLEDARNALLAQGFTVGAPVDTFSAEQPKGAVLGTEPAAGQVRAQGSAVHLLIADSLQVPVLRGVPQDQASAQLRDAGFTVTAGTAEFDAGVDGGSVVRTEPAAGTRVDPAAPAVTVIVSTAVTVPDLTTGTVADAETALTGLGLAASVSGWFAGQSSKVYRQSPEAGTRVEPGSTVTLGTFWS